MTPTWHYRSARVRSVRRATERSLLREGHVVPGIHIVTDSSCDLTSDDLDQLEVQIVPLSIRFGSEEFTDRLDLSVGICSGPLTSPSPTWGNTARNVGNSDRRPFSVRRRALL
ncbi:MAG: DegV family protein [Acidimicrobiales bacterium]